MHLKGIYITRKKIGVNSLKKFNWYNETAVPTKTVLMVIIMGVTLFFEIVDM